jgi:hypothetical protein
MKILIWKEFSRYFRMVVLTEVARFSRLVNKMSRLEVRRVRRKRRIVPTTRGMVLEAEVHCAHLKSAPMASFSSNRGLTNYKLEGFHSTGDSNYPQRHTKNHLSS